MVQDLIQRTSGGGAGLEREKATKYSTMTEGADIVEGI